jgi:hypothetical protein
METNERQSRINKTVHQQKKATHTKDMDMPWWLYVTISTISTVLILFFVYFLF